MTARELFKVVGLISLQAVQHFGGFARFDGSLRRDG
jgi:hypothetical protein